MDLSPFQQNFHLPLKTSKNTFVPPSPILTRLSLSPPSPVSWIYVTTQKYPKLPTPWTKSFLHGPLLLSTKFSFAALTIRKVRKLAKRDVAASRDPPDPQKIAGKSEARREEDEVLVSTRKQR
jgi:hypothetical protein